MGLVKEVYKKVFGVIFIIVFIAVALTIGKFVYDSFLSFIMPTATIKPGESRYANLAPTMTKSGILTSDETWSGVVLVEGDVTVPAGKALTIEPGTIVRFSSNREWGDTSSFSVETYKDYPRSKLIVYGTLISEGTPGKLIVFTSDEAAPQGGDWFGILFKQDCLSTKTSSIAYSIIEYGLKNLVVSYEKGEFCPGNPLVVENNIIRHANKNIDCLEPSPGGPYLRANGIEIYGHPVTVRGNIIYDNFKGIGNDFPSLIENNIIAFHNQQCWGDAPGTGIRATGVDAEVWEKEAKGAALVIQNNLFFKNRWGIEMDGFAPAKVKNNVFLTHEKGIAIFRWGGSLEAVFSSNDFYGNGVDRAASQSGSKATPQPLDPTEVQFDPLFAEEDFWNADFIPGTPEIGNIGPGWDWSWLDPGLLTKT